MDADTDTQTATAAAAAQVSGLAMLLAATAGPARLAPGVEARAGSHGADGMVEAR